MKIGITGHRDLATPQDWEWVREEMTALVKSLYSPGMTGVSSLAPGADQLFAAIVLESGGRLEVVLPFRDYESRLPEDNRPRFNELLARASHLEVLAGYDSDEAAYMAAGRRVVERCEILVAVWDGLPSKGLGGTGDAVAVARQMKRRVYHLNPFNREVMEL